MSTYNYEFSCDATGRPYCRNEKEAIKYRVKDNTCAVFENTKLIYASESERFTKVKHDFSWPNQNLEAFKKYYPNSDEMNLKLIKHEPISHHIAHIYECFYQSGFDEAAVLVNDGKGTLNDSITLAYMKKGEEPQLLKKFPENSSLCAMYGEASSAIFNFEDYSEGKFMGLAGYGKVNGSVYAEWDDENKEIVVHDRKVRKDFKAFIKQHEDVMVARDFAFTIQKNFEEVMVEVVKYFKKLLIQSKIETQNLCMSGGGILNCPTNSKIVNLGLFDNYYASPQPSDGCAESIGNFYATMQKDGKKIECERLESSYLGVTYPHTEFPYYKEAVKKPAEYLSSFLESGGVIAWFQDGAEYGPRALGHRSFLADPSKDDMLDALNKIKGRERWRPLAPIVPEELFHHIFEVDNADMCEFMLRTLPIKEKWKRKMKAVCHVDGTTRPQLLKREVNPFLYSLIMAYFERTHVPCLVNTSLNINGFPIVETPRDFGCLIEEIGFMKEIPDVKAILIEGPYMFEGSIRDEPVVNV